MNTYSFNQSKFTGKILYMDFDTNSTVVDDFNGIKNLTIYGIYDDIKLNVEEKTVDIGIRIDNLARIIFNFLQDDSDDSDDGDCFILLDEIEKLKSELEIKYQKLLGIEEYRIYLNNLYFLNMEVNKKLAAINLRNSIFRRGNR